MVKTLKLSIALIAMFVLSVVALFAASPPKHSFTENPIAVKSAANYPTPVIKTINFAPSGLITVQTVNPITAFQDRVYITDAGKFIEKISRGLANQNPFAKYRIPNLRISSVIARSEKGALFTLKDPEYQTERLIYDLPPNLGIAQNRNDQPKFCSAGCLTLFRLDRSRFV